MACTLDSFLYTYILPIIPLLLGWLLDFLFGDPSWLPHPVVYMGRWISFWEHRLNNGSHRMFKGAILALASIALIYISTYYILNILPSHTGELKGGFHSLLRDGLVMGLQTIAIFFCLAGHTLRNEVRMVFKAVDRSLKDGRQQVARIVGRDTQQLSAQEVRTAALETLAENLSDGVIAPLFWFAVFGVPGMLTYKMVNTLDSMIGYHSPRYKEFGCWAARIDDIANFIPARITALLMLLSATMRPTTLVRRIRFVFHFGPQHASPNSGWPEAALASILNCRFGGSHNYFGELFYKPHIGTNPRPLTTADMTLSIRICFVAECLAIVLVGLSLFLHPATLL